MPSQPSNNPRGRPPLPTAMVRSTYIKVRLTDEEKGEFIDTCGENTQSPSAVLRVLMDQYVQLGGFA